MSRMIKKVFIGIGTVLIFTLILFSTLLVLYMYKVSFELVGILAILMNMLGSASLIMVLCGYYIIGDNILKIREINKKKKELDNDNELTMNIDKMIQIREKIFMDITRGKYEKN